MDIRSIKSDYDVDKEAYINEIINYFHPWALDKLWSEADLKRKEDTVEDSIENNEHVPILKSFVHVMNYEILIF